MNARTPTRRARAVYPGKVAIRHVVEVARDLGLDVAGIEVTPDGTIRAIDARALTKPAEDDLFAQEEAKGHI